MTSSPRTMLRDAELGGTKTAAAHATVPLNVGAVEVVARLASITHLGSKGSLGLLDAIANIIVFAYAASSTYAEMAQ